jgi:murein DD-endopeptidase MepM/ murein hydrolase activator NlpD
VSFVSFVVRLFLSAALALAATSAIAQGSREEQVAAGLYETGLVARMPEAAECPPISLGYGTSVNRSGKKRTAAHGEIHAGVDWALPEGTPVVAIADGWVIERGEELEGPRGNYVAIEHGGLGRRTYSSYVHLSGFNVAAGQQVRRGQVIGYVGMTGRTATHVHLHLNVYGDRTMRVAGRKWRNRYDYLQLLSGDMTPIDPDTKRNQEVPVAYVDEAGQIHPPDARVIWPFACKSKR